MPHKEKPIAAACCWMAVECISLVIADTILPWSGAASEEGKAGRTLRAGALVVRSQRRVLVSKNFEDREQLGDLQQVVNLLGQVQQFHIPVAALNRGKGTDQLPDTRAVDVIDITQIQQQQVTLVIQQNANRLAQQGAAFAQRDPPAQIHHGHAARVPMRCMQSHFLYASWCGVFAEPPCPLWPFASPPGAGSFLDMMTSAPPFWPVTTSNSSINARIRKIPRPDVLNRFSSANGSGTSARLKPFPSSFT